MLILEMRDVSGNLAAAEARNRFVIKHADSLFTPHVARGGMLDRLLKEQSNVNQCCGECKREQGEGSR